MSKPSFTPGPWALYRGEDHPIAVVTYAEQPKNRRVVARVDRPSTSWDDQTIEANAKLIATAPELLEALKEAVKEHPLPKQEWIDLINQIEKGA